MTEPAHESTAEQERERALTALEAGNLKHAFLHAAHGLQAPPHDVKFVSLIVQIYRQAGSEVAVHDPQQLDFALAIALALGRNATGHPAEALQLLCKALLVAPGAHGAVYLKHWIAAGARPDAMVGAVFAGVGDPMIGRIHLRPGERALCERYAPAAHEVLDADDADPQALLAASGLLRRAGDPEAALACAQRLERSLPQVPSAVFTMQGLALRAARRCDEAVEAFRKAQRAGLHPITARCERARACFDAGRWKEARVELDEPEDDDIEQVSMARWLDEQLRGEHDGPAHQIFGQYPDSDAIRLAAYPCQTRLEAPDDMAIQLLARHRDRVADLEINVAKMEAPSTRAAIALAQHGVPDPARAAYAFAGLTAIDPRPADGPRSLSVWVYDGTTPRAAHPPPGPETRQAIAALRASPRSVRCWWPVAIEMGAWLGPRRIPELLGACTSPPDLAPGVFAPRALFEQQMAALLLLANLDQGWHDSARRHVLLGVLRGPVDWTTLCAVIALTEVALDDLAATAEAREAFERLAPRVPTLWSWLTTALKACYKRLPGVPRDAAEAFQKAF